MPSRAKGSAVIIYLEHEDKWVDAEVVDYIRGFGYEVSFELDGLSQSGKYPMKFVKTKGTERRRSRSRERGRPRRSSRSRSRGRSMVIIDPPKKEENSEQLADWAWENVRGRGEAKARDRRSRSRSRDRATERAVGQIIEPEDKIEARIESVEKLVEEISAPVEDPAPVIEPEVEPVKEALPVSEAIESCPWYQELKNSWLCPLQQNLRLFSSPIILPLLTAEVIKSVDGNDLKVPPKELDKFCFSLLIASVFYCFSTIRQLPHLNCRYVFGLVSFLFCAGLVQFSASLYDDVSKNLIQISLGATILTSFFSKSSFNNLVAIRNFASIKSWLKGVVYEDSGLLCTKMAKCFGEIIGLLLATSLLFKFSENAAETTVLAVILALVNLRNLSNTGSTTGSGFLNIFYSAVWTPFLVSSVLRFIQSAADFDSRFYEARLGALLFAGALSLQSAHKGHVGLSHLYFILSALCLIDFNPQTQLFFALPSLYLIF